MKCWNQKCANELSRSATSCPVCGWDKPGRKEVDHSPDWWRCCDVDRNGNRCGLPGALSESTRGSDRWYCYQHFPPFRTRGYTRTPPPDGFFRKPIARPVAVIAEETLERQAIQGEL